MNKLKMGKIEIRNYKSLKNVDIFPKDILALVGQNNSGKSNVIRALELFFKASKSLINDECFYNHDIEEPISIFVTFNNLSEWERENFEPWMDGENLTVGRKIYCEDDSYKIKTYAVVTAPDVPEWLQIDKVKGAKIDEWWPEKDKLVVNGLDFGNDLGTSKPKVGEWKDKVEEFIEKNSDKLNWKETEIENPKGYDGVLKGALPEFIFIPAISDVSKEAKVDKTNPFGQLINSMIEKISSSKLDEVSDDIAKIENKLNRKGGTSRISEIDDIEGTLTGLMSEFMECGVEIEIPMPKLRDIFTRAKIYADDGIRTPIDTKGHGMQRSMIFTILRAYVQLLHIRKAEDRANERSTIFAIEEPELYLHPQSQRTLMSIFYEIAEGLDQVVYCTHSNLFVDIGSFDNICIMKKVNDSASHHSVPTQLDVQDLLDDLAARGITGTEEGIRNQYLNAFNSMINEGFFAKKVVIVEGDSEVYTLPIYADLLDFNLDKNNVSVVHCHGKNSMDRLLRIFNGFEIPTFVWFDGDKRNIVENDENKKDKVAVKATINLLELLNDPIPKIEDLETKVSSNYAVLEYDIETTLTDELENFNEMWEEASSVFGKTGKPLKHKFIAEKIIEIVESGENPEDVIPKTIIEIVDKIKDLSYEGSILHKHEYTDKPTKVPIDS